MYLIVGLGNPGQEYKATRHNIGFDVIDIISSKYNIELNRKKFKGIYGEGRINNEKVILLKPTTYMNLSGESIREIVDFYKISPENIIVAYDDVSLHIGRLRVRAQGSAGGHNGIKSIISSIGTDSFPRVKVGVGGPKDSLVSHVLGRFSNEERKVVDETLDMAANTVICILTEGVNSAMNKFNGFNAIKEE